MANETEHLYVLADNGQTYFSLRLSVTPAMKARVVAREASEELVSGMATSLQWSRGSVTLVPIGVRVATHMRYTSADPIDMTFVESTILNEREGGVYRFDAITTWKDCVYPPVPVPAPNPRVDESIPRRLKVIKVSSINLLL